MIYNSSYINFTNFIKIKHQIKSTKSLNKIICIFGVLVNKKGLEIEKSMLQWLLPEYDVYCIYQKYPGKFFEYPALRFAQWFSTMLNISILLYVHTKGAYKQKPFQENVRALWKHEFTSPRNNIYIKLIENNKTDVSLPFKIKMITLYNGMYISNRAFNLINTIGYHPKNRYYYEKIFMFNKTAINIRIKGVLNNSIISNTDVHFQSYMFLQNFAKNKIIKISKEFNELIKLIIILIFILFLKIIKNYNYFFNLNKKLIR